MTGTKKAEHARDDLWEEYLAAQLSPAQKDAGHAEAVRRAEQAGREGVYERAAAIVGTVKWSVSWDRLRLEER
jgi:hypothetical protein